MVDLSVVFGTYNRRHALRECLESVRAAVGKLSYEVIITDGGSTDGTLDYLRAQRDVTLIEHGKLLGPVAAYNDAFFMTKGDYVAFLNDDLVLEPGTLAAACRGLEERPQVGMFAIPYHTAGQPPKVAECSAGGRRWTFASFGVLRRELGERAGWFDHYYHYCGDLHLALSIWSFGYRVEALEGYPALHRAMDNAIRGAHRWDVPDAKRKTFEDWKRFSETWGNWRGPK